VPGAGHRRVGARPPRHGRGRGGRSPRDRVRRSAGPGLRARW
jgi:hypothetical protein